MLGNKRLSLELEKRRKFEVQRGLLPESEWYALVKCARSDHRAFARISLSFRFLIECGSTLAPGRAGEFSKARCQAGPQLTGARAHNKKTDIPCALRGLE